MILVTALLVLAGADTPWAQVIAPVVSGTVTDEFGRPVAGALAVSGNGLNQSLTGPDGLFSMTIDDGSDFFQVSLPGYRRQTMDAGAGAGLTIGLEPDVADRDSYVDLGYKKQRKNSVAGAYSSVKGEELEKFPSAHLGQKMIGMFSGMGYTVGSNSLGEESVNFLIRGHSTYNDQTPIVLLDGMLITNFSNSDYSYITPEEIESITVLKDASLAAIYGIQSKGGVISIRTKRGYSGELKVRVTIDQSFQQLTKTPESINAAQYVRLRNQAAYNDGFGLYDQFSQEAVGKFTDGSDRLHYPDNDWKAMFLRNFANMQRVGINVAGGNDAVKYFSNINFMHQSQLFKVQETDKFDATPNNMWFNFRTNVDVRINKYLTGYINIGGNIKRMKNAGSGNTVLYEGVYLLPPTMYGPLSPEVEDADDEEKTVDRQVLTTNRISNPVYGELNRRGYYIHQNINLVSQAGMTLDMGFLTRGLSMSGMMSYQTSSYIVNYNVQSYARYMRTGDLEDLEFVVKGSDRNRYLSYNKGKDYAYILNLKADLDYDRTFGDHEVSATAYVLYQREEPQRWYNDAQKLPYQRQSLGLTSMYGYRDTYFLKADVGYSGSGQFHPDRRFTATPAVSAAWVVSNEGFMPGGNLLSYLKVRASYGVLANDSFGNARFLYLDDHRRSNNFDGQIGNPYLEAEKIKMFNVGLDVGLFDNIFLQLDYFKSRIDNMFGYGVSDIPVYQGIALSNYPKTNTGKMENRGFELSLGYEKKVNPDWKVFANGNFSFTRNKIIDIRETSKGNDYLYPIQEEGFRYGQQWGYVVDTSNGNGFYNTPEELAAALPHSFGTPRLGDLIYRDLNGDGVIDEKDRAPIGLTQYPEIYYALTAGFTYRNVDFSFMFQGTGNVTKNYSGYGFYDHLVEGVYNDIHLTAWTEERYQAGEKITAPALSLTEPISNQSNTFWNMNSAVLRLKNVEIGYTVPLNSAGRGSIEKIRFRVSGQNLLSFSDLKTKNVDPEGSGYLNYQPWRVYSIGVGITF